MEKCKRCKIKTVLSKEEIDEMVNRVISMKGVRTVSDEVFTSRMERCLACEKLEYGSTCMLCGCVMQVRSRLESGRCPAKRW